MAQKKRNHCFNSMQVLIAKCNILEWQPKAQGTKEKVMDQRTD